MKVKYGYMPCPTPNCGTRLVVKKNERGTLSWSCAECDGNGYVKKDDAGFARWDNAVVDKVTAPAAPSKPAPAAEPKPAPKAEPKPAPAAPSRKIQTVLG